MYRKNAECIKTFQTWSGLKKHLNVCLKNVSEFISEENQEFRIDNNGSIANIDDEGDTQPEILCNRIPVIYSNPDLSSEESELNENIKSAIQEQTPDFHSRFVEQMQSYALKVENLAVAQNVKDCVFNLTEDLLKNVLEFNCASLKQNLNSLDGRVSEVLNIAQYDVLNEMHKYNTVYKRNKLCEENEFYVKPEEKAIGTHWETRGDPQTKKSYPHHTQSILQYVPITKTLKSLFQQRGFKKAYFDYNSESTGNKHKCTQDNFKDFCCGNVYKRNSMFKKYPDSLQLQIFNDGFEMCDALKSKTN